MNFRISETLEIRERDQQRQICCKNCGHALAAAGTSWKKRAAASAVPVGKMPGSGSSVHPHVVFRQFSCPQCGSLLDSETALPDDPHLEDVVLP